MQKDINVDNPLGSGGKLAVSFAMLLRILWSGKHYSFSPSKLKVPVILSMLHYSRNVHYNLFSLNTCTYTLKS